MLNYLADFLLQNNGSLIQSISLLDILAVLHELSSER